MTPRSPALTLFQGACGFVVGYALTLLLMIAGVLAVESEAGRVIVPRHPLWLVVPILGGWPAARLFSRLDLSGGKAPGKRRRRRLGWRYVRLFTGLWAVIMCGLVLFVGPSRWLAEHSGAWDFVRFPFYGIVVSYAAHYLFKHDIRHLIRRWRWLRRRAKKRIAAAKKQAEAAQRPAPQPAPRTPRR
jgi:hypothetical protein